MRIAPIVLCLALAGCELTEVTLNAGERTVAVHGILDRNNAQPVFIVEYSFNGDTTGRGTARGEGRPQFPIDNATVTLSYPGPGPCTGRTDTLPARAGSPGFYSGVPCRMDPGERALLRVETRDGQVVTGETVMPGIISPQVTTKQGGPVGDTLLNLFRETDTVRIDLGSSIGRGIEVEARRQENATDLELFLFNDSLGMSIAGSVLNPFDNEGTFIFRPGRYYRLAVALGDTNYFDYVRSVGDPITGRGYLNHLKGGIGVFGSVDVREYLLKVGGRQTDPREGLYTIDGTVRSLSFHITLELYIDRDPGFTLTSDPLFGFVQGDVVDFTSMLNPAQSIGRSVDQSGDGVFGSAPGVSGFNPQAFQFSFLATSGTLSLPHRFNISGVRNPTMGQPFPVTVRVPVGNGGNNLQGYPATLTAVQIRGPRSSPAVSSQIERAQ